MPEFTVRRRHDLAAEMLAHELAAIADAEHRNAPRIARIAEDAGIVALTIHGRTRADKYRGEAEYATIAEVKNRVSIPVIANGDITTPAKARAVLAATGADGLMIGRGAQGRPWIFREIVAGAASQPKRTELRAIVREHLTGIHSLYGDRQGVRIARKHIGWYLGGMDGAAPFRAVVNRVEDAVEQCELVDAFLLERWSADSEVMRAAA